MKKNDTVFAKSPLCDLFGSTPTSIMLTFFIANNVNDFNISEISYATHLSRPTITKVLKPLLRFGFVVESRRLGHTKLYKLGDANHEVQTSLPNAIKEVNEVLVRFIIREEQKKVLQ